MGMLSHYYLFDNILLNEIDHYRLAINVGAASSYDSWIHFLLFLYSESYWTSGFSRISIASVCSAKARRTKHL